MRTVQHLYQCSHRVQSGRFEDRGEALSATDAHRLEAQPAATAPQFVQHAGEDVHAGCAEGSTSAMSSNDNPVRLKSFCTASTGPWPIVAGSHPAAVQSTQA